MQKNNDNLYELNEICKNEECSHFNGYWTRKESNNKSELIEYRDKFEPGYCPECYSTLEYDIAEKE